MKEYEIPQDAGKKNKLAAKVTRTRKFVTGLSIGLGVPAVLCLIGVLVSVLVYEFGTNTLARDRLLYILMGAFAGGAVLFAIAAFLFGKLASYCSENELDFLERCDGLNSFFVGDGTLATFEKDGIRIHTLSGKEKEVRVPYSEMRFFSVCTRRRPREKGQWSVVIEIPVKHLTKDGKANKNDPPALVQADAKPRLCNCLKEHNLTLLGERRDESQEKEKPFTPLRKFVFPDRAARKRSLTVACIAFLLIVVGALVAVFWQIALGTIVGVFGLFFAVRAIMSYISSKRELTFYEEGVYWREKRTNSGDSAFLKWEEVETVTAVERDGMPLLRFGCAYGAYHFPNAPGALEFIRERKPEKIKE